MRAFGGSWKPGRNVAVEDGFALQRVHPFTTEPLLMQIKADYKVQSGIGRSMGFLQLRPKKMIMSAPWEEYAQRVSSFVTIVSSNAYKATSSTRLTSLTCWPARSSSTGIRSRSSLSCASENQLLMGTACCGWKMYDVGELSMMMVSLRSRPI